MSRTTSAAVLQQIYGEQMSDALVCLLKLEDTVSGEVSYHARNPETVSHQGQDYEPAYFELAAPSEENGTLSEVQLVVDNTNLEIGRIIERVQARPTATLTIVNLEDPDTVEWGPFVYELEQGQYNVERATARLVYQDVNTRRYPKHGYTPGDTPELYRSNG